MAQNQNIGLLGQYLTLSTGNITISSNVTLASGGGSGSFSNNQPIAVSNLSYSASTVVKAYTFFNTTTNSLDTIFI